ncbi:Ribosomal RNA large subunit methyltransferase I [Zostera marina]|uniref:Ribosomal RNA large subunit methyltransferase I n=1 Tax=Zostera marina TaxID=29655 RepID=A0A0K9PRT6_ZOSMR|nr:Ribosomal RNA large subunit methyltransferase I [Zostera marina]
MQISARLVKSLAYHSSAVAPISATGTATLEEIASNRRGLARVVLKKGKTQLFKDGSPMVYSGAVDRVIGRPPPKTGDVVLVADGAEKPIGWGLYNSVSMFCVRLMQLEEEVISDVSCALDMDKLIETRIYAATDLRRKMGLPSSDTNAYRLVNSEGDRLSGLIVDVFGDAAVIASSAAWVEKYRAEIELHLSRISNLNNLIWRQSIEVLKEEGLDFTRHQKDNSPSALFKKLKIIENGICYSVSTEGQKTGFYADQRENRQFISSISKDQKVLDVCCYSGGFSLNAAKGGASSVTGIDSSLTALELANENVLLNNLDPQKVTFFGEDASVFMKDAISRKESWDLVILDPPKLAPRRKVLQKALGMYRNLNSLAMKVTKPGGLLMTCSCSGAVAQNEGTFQRMLQASPSMFLIIIQINMKDYFFQDAASSTGRKITIIRQSGAGNDHPLDLFYPEGAYLTNFLVRVL